MAVELSHPAFVFEPHCDQGTLGSPVADCRPCRDPRAAQLLEHVAGQFADDPWRPAALADAGQLDVAVGVVVEHDHALDALLTSDDQTNPRGAAYIDAEEVLNIRRGKLVVLFQPHPKTSPTS